MILEVHWPPIGLFSGGFPSQVFMLDFITVIIVVNNEAIGSFQELMRDARVDPLSMNQVSKMDFILKILKQKVIF